MPDALPRIAGAYRATLANRSINDQYAIQAAAERRGAAFRRSLATRALRGDVGQQGWPLYEHCSRISEGDCLIRLDNFRGSGRVKRVETPEDPKSGEQLPLV